MKQRNATPKSTRNLPREAPGAPKFEPKSLLGPFRVPRDPPELTTRSSRSPPKAKMVAKRNPWEPSRDPKGAPGEARDGPETKKNARGHHFSPEKIDAHISDRFSIDLSVVFQPFLVAKSMRIPRPRFQILANECNPAHVMIAYFLHTITRVSTVPFPRAFSKKI